MNVFKCKVPDDTFNKLKIKISKVAEKDFYGKDLAGNIKKEYSMNADFKELSNFLIGNINSFAPLEDYVKKIVKQYLQDDSLTVELCLYNLWVNLMAQNEFNPLHIHEGVFSFIIFVKVPYKIEEMRKNAPGIKSNSNVAGALEFVKGNSDTINDLTSLQIHADETWEQQCLIFPSVLNHCVYPFYKVDDYRITVSGNLALKRKNA
tara:strand:+ start:457 stop:1074 length:618 start_codon:yes stop_codon:yes gene_type:complete